MIGIGIIGAGFIGATHARAIAAVPGLRLAAVCRPDAAVADFAAEHGGTPYRDHRALLDDPAVHAVLIATPHHLHEPVARDAAAAGRHIMLEKPIAPDPAACTRIITAAAAAGIHLLPGHTMRFTRACRTARDLLAGPDTGPLRYAAATFAKTWMEPNRRPWHLDPTTGGGMLMTAGIHALDRVLYLADRRVTHVAAIVDTEFHDQPADDVALLQLRFEGGGGAQIASLGFRHGAATNDALLTCAHATLRLDFSAGLSLGRDNQWHPVPDSTEPDWANRAIRRQWQEFAAAIRGEAPLPVTGEQARQVVAVIHAAFAAQRLRREVALDEAPPK